TAQPMSSRKQCRPPTPHSRQVERLAYSLASLVGASKSGNGTPSSAKVVMVDPWTVQAAFMLPVVYRVPLVLRILNKHDFLGGVLLNLDCDVTHGSASWPRRPSRPCHLLNFTPRLSQKPRKRRSTLPGTSSLRSTVSSSASPQAVETLRANDPSGRRTTKPVM